METFKSDPNDLCETQLLNQEGMEQISIKQEDVDSSDENNVYDIKQEDTENEEEAKYSSIITKEVHVKEEFKFLPEFVATRVSDYKNNVYDIKQEDTENKQEPKYSSIITEEVYVREEFEFVPEFMAPRLSDYKESRKKRKCSAVGCTSTAVDTKLFCFPVGNNELCIQRLRVWADVAGRPDLAENRKQAYLCTKHFERSEFTNDSRVKLLRTAVPSKGVLL